MNIEFLEAIEELEREKHMPKDVLIEAIESALVSAYKKNYGTSQNVRVSIDRENGDINVFMRRDIVEEVEDPFSQATLEEAQEIDPEYEIGDVIEYQVTPKDFGRIAAQTAKQVVIQRIREAERGMIFDDYISRTGQVVTGVIQRVSNNTVFVNMGRAEGILAANEQIPGEHFKTNDRIKVYVMDVKRTSKGPQVFLSRTHPGLVKELFRLEVPEIQEDVIEIKSVSREAGSRSKIAVCTYDENVDPVGSCVGPRGQRVQAVVDELGGEKIDIINWSDDPGKMISAALSPSKVEMVLINQEEKSALVVVPDYQLSLAIGKEGQNVRLAARLCGWKIDIKSRTAYDDMPQDEKNAAVDNAEVAYQEADEESTEVDIENLTPAAVKKLKKAELINAAEKLELEIPEKATVAVLTDLILEAIGE